MKRCVKCGKTFGGIVCECSFVISDLHPLQYRPDDNNVWKQVVPSGDKPNEYVCGFLFQHELRTVVLIQKSRPEWQAGKLNGVGGHVKHGELSVQAMAREFTEETGCRRVEWTKFFVASFRSGIMVHFFFSLDPGTTHDPVTKTDESVFNFPVPLVQESSQVLPNLRWLVPMALSNDRWNAGELH